MSHEKSIRKLAASGELNVNFNSKSLVGTCEPCIAGKQTRLPFNHMYTETTRPLEVVYTDICGPIETRV